MFCKTTICKRKYFHEPMVRISRLARFKAVFCSGVQKLNNSPYPFHFFSLSLFDCLIQVVKAILAAQSSSSFTMIGESLIRSIQTCFNIAVRTENEVNKATAIATLTQMINAIMTLPASEEDKAQQSTALEYVRTVVSSFTEWSFDFSFRFTCKIQFL